MQRKICFARTQQRTNLRVAEDCVGDRVTMLRKIKGRGGGEGRAGRGRWKRLGGRGKKCRVHRNSHGARTDLNNTPGGCNDGEEAIEPRGLLNPLCPPSSFSFCNLRTKRKKGDFGSPSFTI